MIHRAPGRVGLYATGSIGIEEIHPLEGTLVGARDLRAVGQDVVRPIEVTGRQTPVVLVEVLV